MQNYIFDFDGTLANSGKTGVLATQAAFRELTLPVPQADLINYYMGIPIEVSFKKMVPDHNFTDQEFAELLTCFRQYYHKLEAANMTLVKGILPALQRLSEQGKQLYVVSSKHSKALLRNLRELKISRYFADVVGSDQVVHFKPAPDGVLAVIKLYNLNPHDCVMIGDAIFDLQMGKSAGIHTCGVTWGAHDTVSLLKEHPDYILATPDDLPTI